MKLQLIIISVLCLGLVLSETNGRRRSQRRRLPPAETPENLEENEPVPSKHVEQEEPVVVEAPKNEKPEPKTPEVTQPTQTDEEKDKKKNNGSSPLSQLFAPRGTRRPRPAPQAAARRPRPTLPSFIRNPNRAPRPTSNISLRTSSTSAAAVQKATSSSASRSSKPSGRRTTPAPESPETKDSGNKRFGQNRQKPARPAFRATS